MQLHGYFNLLAQFVHLQYMYSYACMAWSVITLHYQYVHVLYTLNKRNMLAT